MRWILALAIVLPAAALADQTHYVGGHPLADEDFCHIEAPHVHAIAPIKVHRPLYRVHNRRLHFVGDPSAHGYDGPTVRYVGHHPIAAASYHVEADRQFLCFIDGPHVHAYAPAPSLRFEVKGGAHWYVGPVPPRYKKLRARYRPMTAYYAEVDYPRPVVSVRAPAAYAFGTVGIGVGVRGGVAVPAPAAGVAVEGPSLRATVMAPSVELVVPSVRVEGGVSVGGAIGVGGAPVVVHDRPPGHYKRHKRYRKRNKRYRKRHKRYRKRNKSYRKRNKKRRRGGFRNRHRRDFRR